MSFSSRGLIYFRPPPYYYWNNIECGLLWDRERKVTMKRFIWWTNKRKITKWWDTNHPTGVKNRHDIDLIITTSKHSPLHFLLIILWFILPLHSVVSHLLQCIWIALDLYLVSTTTRQSRSSPSKKKTPPLTKAVQTRRSTIHLTINKRHR